ncbi:hypothetical protein HK100_011797 [Physocladia obscura]|uniref:Nucleoporin Nup188 N-terminal subdomain III domain-containing protein n=1 Tax=Physocladia obscura TaxID=109957 RepID=A0AAD5XI26_9FUNG|nr:hypothetical protein HK100_011797 [Physocladia obscura]
MELEYKPPSAASRKKVEAGKLNYHGTEITIKASEQQNVLTFSALADLDEQQSFVVLRDFLHSQLKLTGSGVMISAVDLNAALNFYSEERCALLQSLAALIRAAQDDLHPYQSIIGLFISEITQSESFVKNILQQFMAKITARIPTFLEQQNRRAVMWATQNMREQKALLELLFLVYYDELVCDTDQAVEIISKIDSVRFGLKQPNSPLFEDEGHLLWKDVVHLCVLICLAVLNLEQITGQDDGMETEIALVKYPNHMVTLTKLFANYLSATNPSEGQVFSPLILCWSCILQKISENAEAVQNLKDNGISATKASQSFIKSADSLGVFEYIEASIKSYAVLKNNPIILGYKSVFKGLLTLFITCFNVDETPKFHNLIECFVQLFQESPEICEQFWLQDYPLPDRRSLLDAARARFPYEQKSFVKLFGSLCSSRTATFVFEYLKSIQTFTGTYENGTIRTFPGTPVLAEDYNLAQGLSNRLQMYAAAGSKVHVLSINPQIFQIYTSYSAFHIFICHLAIFLENNATLTSGTAPAFLSLCDTIADWLVLINKLLENCPAIPLPTELSRTAVLSHLCDFQVTELPNFTVNELTRMICRAFACGCVADSTLPTRLLTACMKTLSLLLPENSGVWYLVRQEIPIPRYSASSDSAIGGGRYMQQRLLPFEKASGEYSTTLAFLELVITMCNECQNSTSDEHGDLALAVQADVLISCVKYVHSEIFASYNSWRYARVSDKLDIGEKVLEIFNKILRDFTVSKTNAPLAPLRELIVNGYLDSSLRQVSPVLEILSTGNLAPLTFYNARRIHEVTILEESIVQALLFVKALLLERKITGKIDTLLEHAILDRTVTFNTSDGATVTELVHIIASYISYEYNLQIPLIATEVLVLLCEVAAEWTPRPPSFIGYFGPDVSKIISSIISVSADDSFDLATDDESVLVGTKESIQRAAFNFVNVAVQTQPGLGALFLNGESILTSPKKLPRKNDKENEIRETSILHAIIIVLSNWSEFLNLRTTVVPTVLRLIETLWHAAPEFHSAVQKLRMAPQFWENLYKIFSAELEESGDGHVQNFYLDISRAIVIRIFVNEVFYVGSNKSGKLNDWITKALQDSVQLDKMSTAFANVMTKNGIYVEVSRKQVLDFVSDFKLTLDIESFARPVPHGRFESGFNDFGSNYFYDVELLLIKEGKYLAKSGRKHDIVEAVQQVNRAYSSSKIGFENLKSTFSFIKIAALKLGNESWSEIGTPRRQILMDIISLICKTLSTEYQYSHIKLEICSEFSSLLVLLLTIWSSDCEKLSTAEILKSTSPLFEFLQYLRACVSNSGFRELLFSMNIVAHTHYNQIWTAILITIETIKRLSAVTADRKFSNTCSEFCLNVLPYTLRPLEEILSMDSLVNSSTTFECCVVLMAIVNELVTFVTEVIVHAQDCVAQIIQSNLILLLLNTICSAGTGDGIKISMNNSENVTVEVTESEYSISMSALRILLLFARIPTLSDTVASNGLIASFCNSQISLAISSGHGIEAYSGQERNLAHQLWCQMVKVVSITLRTVETPGLFQRSVTGFLKLHWKQVKEILDLPFENILNCARLEEVEIYSELSYGLVVACTNAGAEEVDYSFLEAIRGLLVQTLRQSVYMLRHPATLSNKGKVMSLEIIDGVSNVTENEFKDAFDNHLKSLILLIVRNILAYLCVAFNVSGCISVGDTSAFDNKGLSLSTWLECLSFAVDSLSRKKTNQKNIDTIRERAFGVENLCLIISQLISLIFAHVAASSNGEEGLHEALENMQQTANVLDIMGRDGRADDTFQTTLGQAQTLLSGLDSFAAQFAATNSDAAQKLKILGEDFVFNLRLLEERDAELDSYEESIVRLKDLLNERDGRVSELQILLADKQHDLDACKAFHSSQDHHHAELMKKTKREHEVRKALPISCEYLIQVHDQTALQEMLNATHEKSIEIDEIRINYELKLKSLQEELELTQGVDKLLKETQWEYSDYKNETNGVIANLRYDLAKATKELEIQSACHQTERSDTAAEFSANEKVLKTQCEKLESEVEMLSGKALTLEYQIKSQSATLSKLESKSKKEIRERDYTIQKLEEKLQSVSNQLTQANEVHESKIQKIVAKFAKEQDKTNLAIQSMEKVFSDEIDSTRNEVKAKEIIIYKLQKKLQKYQHVLFACEDELSKRGELDAALKNQFEEQKIIWDKHLQDLTENMKRQHDEQVNTFLQEKKKTATDVDKLNHEIQLLRAERDEFKLKILELDNNFRENENSSHEIQRVTELENQYNDVTEDNFQNNLLQNIIKQMRSDMEAVQSQILMQEQFSQKDDINTPYMNLVAQDSIVTNQQLQRLAEIVEQKQQLIDSLLKSTKHTPHASASKSFADDLRETTETVDNLKIENQQLRSKMTELTQKLINASSTRMQLMNVMNGLQAELRGAKVIIAANIFKKHIDIEVKHAETQAPEEIIQQQLQPSLTKKKPSVSSRKKSSLLDTAEKETEKQRRMRGVRNWNQIEDV